MGRPSSLAFRALDQHVVAGRADEPALVTPSGSLSYAQLLHESASFAGGLRDLGLGPGVPVLLSVEDRHVHVLSVLAIVRLGAEPVDEAPFTISADPVVVRVGDQDYAFDLVVRAGRVNPASAAISDVDGYADRMERRFGDVLTTLVHGGTLS